MLISIMLINFLGNFRLNFYATMKPVKCQIRFGFYCTFPMKKLDIFMVEAIVTYAVCVKGVNCSRGVRVYSRNTAPMTHHLDNRILYPDLCCSNSCYPEAMA